MKVIANVLHLCNDFMGSRVYMHLYEHMHQLGYAQIAFVPTRNANSEYLHRQKYSNLPYNVIYSQPLKPYHRFLFKLKRQKLKKEVLRRVNVRSIDLVHATTLFSDGALAYDIYREFSIPYIVTVRSTDIYVFLKYRPDLIRLAFKIMKYASHVVFVSNALQKRFFAHKAIAKRVGSFIKKCEVIPNGVDEFWLNNIEYSPRISAKKILYVGALIPRKNALHLAQAVLELKASYPELELTIVGGGPEQKKIEALAEQYQDSIQYHGVIKNRSKLMSIFRKHDIFAMPSYNETFGLVYIEALSQGLPILYSCDDGVDGLIPDCAGCNVDPHSQKSITRGLEKMLQQFHTFNLSDFDFVRFNWHNIAERYNEIYNNALG